MSDFVLELRSTCDTCASSKVKCNGKEPCERCSRKGIDCFYSPKKKRGPAPKDHQLPIVVKATAITNSIENKDSGISYGNAQEFLSRDKLNKHERISWSVFFTLYKHYGVSCSLYWFSRQLYKIRKFLQSKGNVASLKRLDSWMVALKVDPKELEERVEKTTINQKKWATEIGRAGFQAACDNKSACIPSVLNFANPFHLRVDGRVEKNEGDIAHRTSHIQLESSLDQSFFADPNNTLPSLRCSLDYRDFSAEPVIVANWAFYELFGISGDSLANDLKEYAGGFLPWGGDIMSRILFKESDLLAWIQLLAIKFNAIGFPKSWPIKREIPSCNVFEINWLHSERDGPLNCIIKSIHREVISDDSTFLTVELKFEPFGPPIGKAVADTHKALPEYTGEVDFLIANEPRVQLPPKRPKLKSANEPDLGQVHEFLNSDLGSPSSGTLPFADGYSDGFPSPFQSSEDSEEDWLDDLLVWSNDGDYLSIQPTDTVLEDIADL